MWLEITSGSKGLSDTFPVCLPGCQGSHFIVNSVPLTLSELRLLLKVSSKNCYIKIEPVDKGSFAEVIEVLGRSVLEDS